MSPYSYDEVCETLTIFPDDPEAEIDRLVKRRIEATLRILRTAIEELEKLLK